MIILIAGFVVLTACAPAWAQITLFTGRQEISDEWDFCVQTKQAIHDVEMLFFEFERPAAWTLSIDGSEVRTFTGKSYDTYKGSLKAGTHLIKIAVQKPATLLMMRGSNGVELCP